MSFVQHNMISWPDLQAYASLKLTERTHSLPRSKKVLAQYRAKLHAESSHGGDPGWNLHHRLFGDNWAPAVLTLNEYPYDVSADVTHYVVWFRSKRGRPVNWSRLIPRGAEYVHFANAPQNRSIEAIHHIHLFVRGAGSLMGKAWRRLLYDDYLLPLCGVW